MKIGRIHVPLLIGLTAVLLDPATAAAAPAGAASAKSWSETGSASAGASV
jgi:hypothetical protein